MQETKGQRNGSGAKPRRSSARSSSARRVKQPRTLADLRRDPANRRTHPTRNVAMIADALRAVGAARSIVIDEQNEVLAGNGVLGAQQVGISKVQVVEVPGDTIVAVRRTGLSAAQKRDLALYDNRAAELAEWNVPQLQADLLNGADLKPFFTDDELRQLKVTMKVLAGAGNQIVPGNFLVVVTCASEDDQIALLQRLTAEGLSCKALIS